jgi:hypothetical protein
MRSCTQIQKDYCVLIVNGSLFLEVCSHGSVVFFSSWSSLSCMLQDSSRDDIEVVRNTLFTLLLELVEQFVFELLVGQCVDRVSFLYIACIDEKRLLFATNTLDRFGQSFAISFFERDFI